jgi:hypothetical protein
VAVEHDGVARVQLQQHGRRQRQQAQQQQHVTDSSAAQRLEAMRSSNRVHSPNKCR